MLTPLKKKKKKAWGFVSEPSLYEVCDHDVLKLALILVKLATILNDVVHFIVGDLETHVPDVPELVQKMIEELYDAVIYHQVNYPN